MTIKATSALSILAIWVTMVPAVMAEPGAWWSLIFAVMATGAIGVSAWRRLGLSRVIAISGTWLGTAFAVQEGEAWVSIFAFLATAAVVYSVMRRDALLLGLGIAVTWLMTGIVVAAHEGDGSWICVFAFLTSGAVANSLSRMSRGVAAAGWWGAAGILMLAADGWHWLAIVAFVLTAGSIGFGDFQVPRRIEWDFFERDDSEARIKTVN